MCRSIFTVECAASPYDYYAVECLDPGTKQGGMAAMDGLRRTCPPLGFCLCDRENLSWEAARCSIIERSQADKENGQSVSPRKTTSTKRFTPAISMKSTPQTHKARARSLPGKTTKIRRFLGRKAKIRQHTDKLDGQLWVRTGCACREPCTWYAPSRGCQGDERERVPWSSTLKKLCTFACHEDPESCVFS